MNFRDVAYCVAVFRETKSIMLKKRSCLYFVEGSTENNRIKQLLQNAQDISGCNALNLTSCGWMQMQ